MILAMQVFQGGSLPATLLSSLGYYSVAAACAAVN